MKADIRVCGASVHERPRYTLAATCPDCEAETENSAPAPYNPEDRYGEYRRRVKRRERDG